MNVKTILYIELNQELRGGEFQLVNTLFGIEGKGCFPITQTINKELHYTTHIFDVDGEDFVDNNFILHETKGLFVSTIGDCIENVKDPILLKDFKRKVIKQFQDEIAHVMSLKEKKTWKRFISSKEKMIERTIAMSEIPALPAMTTISVSFDGEFEVKFMDSIKETINLLSEEYEGLQLRKVYTDRVETERFIHRI